MGVPGRENLADMRGAREKSGRLCSRPINGGNLFFGRLLPNSGGNGQATRGWRRRTSARRTGTGRLARRCRRLCAPRLVKIRQHDPGLFAHRSPIESRVPFSPAACSRTSGLSWRPCPYQSCRPSLPEGLRRAVSAVIPKVRAFRQGGNEDVMPLANSGIRAHGTVRRTQNIQSGHCAFQSVRFAEEEFAFSARVPSHVISLFVRAARAGGRPRGPRGLHAGPKAGEDVNRHNVAEQYIHSDPNREGGKGLPSYWLEFSESRGQPDAEEAEDERPRA